jgi:DNA-binding NarL/FixJ family response regulator
MSKIKVAIVDDHEDSRNSLIILLKSEENIEIAQIAINGQDIINQLEPTQPDIILMDISMPIMNGIVASKIIREKYPAIKIIAYTFFDQEKNIVEMNKVGVRSFVAKGSPDELLKAIQVVHNGGYYLPDEIANSMQLFLSKSEPKEIIELTSTEKIMLEAISKGWTSKQIAKVINKSPRTIDKYRQEIYSKFEVESKEQLVAKAVRIGLL